MAVKGGDKDGKDDAAAALWREAVKDVRALGDANSPIPAKPARKRLRISPAEPILPPPPSQHRKGGGTDRRTESRLRKGEIKIEGRMDLHGARLKEAQQQLQQFILQSVAAGKRCVLVITGKGTGEGTGSIRRGFRHWMDADKIRPYILSVSPAVPKHGGDGAWYVYLRKIKD